MGDWCPRTEELGEGLAEKVSKRRVGEGLANFLSSAPSKWGRAQMGSDGFDRIFTGLYFFTPLGVRLVPLKTHDFKGF